MKSVQPKPSFEERLSGEIQRMRDEARRMPPGVERDARTKKAAKFEVVLQIDRWVKSPGLQPTD
jgi:hypothetical protein